MNVMMKLNFLILAGFDVGFSGVTANRLGRFNLHGCRQWQYNFYQRIVPQRF